MAESPVAIYRSLLADIPVHVPKLIKKFPQEKTPLTTMHKRNILSVSERLRQFFEAHPERQNPYLRILKHIIKTKSSILYSCNLRAGEYLENDSIRHIIDPRGTQTDVLCDKRIQEFCALMLEVGVAYPFLEILDDHPKDKCNLYEQASTWAIKKRRNSCTHIQQMTAQYVADEMLRCPELVRKKELTQAYENPFERHC